MLRATTRNISLVTGLILFAFAFAHFCNHAVGLFDLEAMDRVQGWRLALTRSLPGTVILAAALVLHVVAALLKLAARRTLRLPAWELMQLALGLAIPFLLLPHIVDTRGAWTLFDVQDNYLYELSRLWPAGALTQSLLLVVVWIHGCLGIHHWLKLRAWYRALQAPLLLAAIALPLAALAGFAVSGQAVATLISDQTIADQMRAVTHWPTAFAEQSLLADHLIARAAFAALLLAVALWLVLRRLGMLAATKIDIAYAGGPKVRSAIGPTLLEISRANGIAHTSRCGGRARCGTCRVRIDQGGSTLPQPNLMEQIMLASLNAESNVRLACQLRPAAPLVVTRLVQPTGGADLVATSAESADDAGVQRPLCLLHLQLRDFNEIARGRLPYDTIFILNEFFAAAGPAIDRNTGRIERFLGDGLFAVFGEERSLEQGCRDALQAARAIDLSLDRLNEKVAAEIGRPVAISIGIHAGAFVTGRIGLGQSSVIAVVGPGTDLPRRIAAVGETANWQIALSREAAQRAGLREAGEGQVLNVEPDGNKIDVVGYARARDIELVEPAGAAQAAAG